METSKAIVRKERALISKKGKAPYPERRRGKAGGPPPVRQQSVESRGEQLLFRCSCKEREKVGSVSGTAKDKLGGGKMGLDWQRGVLATGGKSTT